MKKILTVLGARPQFIKAARVSHVIREKYKDHFREVIVHTGQHYDRNMSDVFFEEMKIPQPDHFLNLEKGLHHGAMTAAMLTQLENLLEQERPNIVLIYGDTNSTLAGALAASKLNIPVAHVEAGLRSFNRRMPEEINRIVADHVSTILFPPTEHSRKQLAKEGITQNVHVVGDVMYDAVLFYKQYATRPKTMEQLPENFYLVTCHRQENTDCRKSLVNIFEALQELSSKYPIVFPLHPRTKKYIDRYGISAEGIHLIRPTKYFEMLYLLEHAKVVLTDSGGLQKEAYYFKRPVVIMREETEWQELVDSGIAKIAGADREKIIQAVGDFEDISSFPPHLYGDGKTGEKIVQIIYDKLS